MQAVLKAFFRLIFISSSIGIPAVGFSLQNDDSNHKADSLFKVFKYHIENYEYKEATVAIDSLIAVRKTQKDTIEWVRSMFHKAEMLRSISANEAAIEVISQAESFAQNLKPSTVKSVFYNRKAAILYELKDKPGALKALKTSQEIDSIKGLKWQARSNLNIEGAIYRDLGEHDKAQKVFRESMKIALDTQDTADYARVVFNLCLSFQRTDNPDSVIFYARKIAELKAYAEDVALIDNAYRLIARSYAKLNKYDSAYIALDSAHFYALQRMESIIDSRVESFKLKDELNHEKLKNSVLESENRASTLTGYILLFVLISLGLVAFIIWKQRMNFKTISEQRNELNEELHNSLEFKNKLIGIVAHDIRNPMASITSMVELYRAGGIDANLVGDFMGKLETSAKQVNLLLENLLNWVLSQKGELEPEISNVKPASIIKEVLHEIEAQLLGKQIQMELHLEEGTIATDKDFFALIVRNLLSNAIKFSKVGGRVVVSFSQQENKSILKVQDFGVGIPEDKLALLSSGSTYTARGTEQEKGTGVGVQLIRELIQALDGTLNFTSKEGEGTVVVVEFSALMKD